MSAITTSEFINFLNANLQSTFIEAATPSSESLAVLQGCIDAAISHIETFYALPATYSDDVRYAVLMHSSDLWDARKNPSGMTVGEFGVVRAPGFNNRVLSLLAPYKRLDGFSV